MNQIFNFSPGPAMLPIEVLQRAEQELRNWNGLGISVMEISHRSKEFLEVARSSERDLRELLIVPNNYKILFCQGGARAQFSAVPMNLIEEHKRADYINSGYWTQSAIKEAKKYCDLNIINVSIKINGMRAIKPMCEWDMSQNSAYLHYCPNETVDGLAINELPNFGNDKIIVADLSSVILSQPLDISRFGIIYAGAQKNIGPAGITVVIIREDLIKRSSKTLPSILNYSTIAENYSMFNTPPTFAWYLSGLVLKWLKSKGGLIEIDKLNQAKASLLYRTIDNSDFYYNDIIPENRSRMNVTFRLKNSKLNTLFLKESYFAGLYALQGHRSVGGMRASLYNAMPILGVQTLADFMLDFAKRYG